MALRPGLKALCYVAAGLTGLLVPLLDAPDVAVPVPSPIIPLPLPEVTTIIETVAEPSVLPSASAIHDPVLVLLHHFFPNQLFLETFFYWYTWTSALIAPLATLVTAYELFCVARYILRKANLLDSLVIWIVWIWNFIAPVTSRITATFKHILSAPYGIPWVSVLFYVSTCHRSDSIYFFWLKRLVSGSTTVNEVKESVRNYLDEVCKRQFARTWHIT
jgi:hypothetical protein